MVQEFLGGQELGAGCYAGLVLGKLASVFVKKKLPTAAGETDKSALFKGPAPFAWIEASVQESGWRGPVGIDIFDINGTYYISEANPRFGGGHPQAYECRCNYMDMAFANLRGQADVPRIGSHAQGIDMMKHSEVPVSGDKQELGQ